MGFSFYFGHLVFEESNVSYIIVSMIQFSCEYFPFLLFTLNYNLSKKIQSQYDERGTTALD